MSASEILAKKFQLHMMHENSEASKSKQISTNYNLKVPADNKDSKFEYYFGKEGQYQSNI